MKFLALAIAAVLLALSPVYASDSPLLVFGASSLTEALPDAGKAYARTGRPVRSEEHTSELQSH